ncbi:MAG: hypothetical protein ABUL65_00100, partial [Opitutus sp.]
RGRHGAGGFTLPEVVLVLLVSALAGVLLFTMTGRVRQNQRREQFAAELQEFEAAFQAYHRQQRTWPPSTKGEAVMPKGMEDVLVETDWVRGSPFGGSYGWDSRGAVVLTAFAPAFPLDLTRADLLAIDRQIDDGDPATGRLRTGFNGWPVYYVGEIP